MRSERLAAPDAERPAQIARGHSAGKCGEGMHKAMAGQTDTAWGRDPWGPRVARLRDLGIPVREWEPLAHHTTFRIGGPARALAVPRDAAELLSTLDLASQFGWPILMLGEGSKLLVHDRGIDRLVVAMNQALSSFDWSPDGVEVGTGLAIREVARAATLAGLSGLEFYAGVPGSVGGALYMNAGGRGIEMSQLVEWVRVYDLDTHCAFVVRGKDMTFQYRTSILRRYPWLALSTRLVLRAGDPEATTATMEDFLAHRRRAQPVEVPSAGSVFVNPPGGRASTLLDQAGVRGWTEGQARISSFHANFIVNPGGASAHDVFKLMQRMHAAVNDRHGIRLRPEIIGVGFGAAWQAAFDTPSL